MKSKIIRIIPRKFRRRAIGVTLSIFLRALLNFIGLAMLVPVLVLILDADNIHQNQWLDWLYSVGGFSSESRFAMAVCGGVVAIIAIKCLLSLALFKVERNFTFDLYHYLSHRLYTTYHNRGMAFIKDNNSAVLTRNVNVVSLTFVTGILKPIASIASEALLFVMLFVSMAIYNPMVAALVVAIFLPATLIYYYLVRRRLNNYGTEENRAHRDKARCVSETFRGYADIEINNAFPKMLDQFEQAQRRIISLRSKNDTIATLPQMFTEVGLAVGMAIMVAAALGSKGGDMQLLFGIFAVAAVRLMPSVRSIMSGWSAIKYNLYTIDILADADINDKEQPVTKSSAERMTFKEAIEVRGVGFRFDDRRGDKEIFRGLNMTIRKGERVGIRGASGAGKTTLFNLLLGFYAPTAGEILIDGTPLDESNRRRWQNSIGYVSQGVFITDGSLLENVAFGIASDKIDRERATEALKAADMGDFIASLPDGIDSKIGEGGCRLSGGQRQRIGIARALYKQAEILFFDEATSSLDSQTEENINRSIEAISANNKELTIVVIAHRESSLEYCDRIITID